MGKHLRKICALGLALIQTGCASNGVNHTPPDALNTSSGLILIWDRYVEKRNIDYYTPPFESRGTKISLLDRKAKLVEFSESGINSIKDLVVINKNRNLSSNYKYSFDNLRIVTDCLSDNVCANLDLELISPIGNDNIVFNSVNSLNLGGACDLGFKKLVIAHQYDPKLRPSLFDEIYRSNISISSYDDGKFLYVDNTSISRNIYSIECDRINYIDNLDAILTKSSFVVKDFDLQIIDLVKETDGSVSLLLAVVDSSRFGADKRLAIVNSRKHKLEYLDIDEYTQKYVFFSRWRNNLIVYDVIGNRGSGFTIKFLDPRRVRRSVYVQLQ